MDAWNPTSPIVAPPFVPVNVRIPIPDPSPIWGDGVASPAGPADNDASVTVSHMKELVDIYRRLRDTPTPSDINTGDALNVALDEATEQTSLVRSVLAPLRQALAREGEAPQAPPADDPIPTGAGSSDRRNVTLGST